VEEGVFKPSAREAEAEEVVVAFPAPTEGVMENVADWEREMVRRALAVFVGAEVRVGEGVWVGVCWRGEEEGVGVVRRRGERDKTGEGVGEGLMLGLRVLPGLRERVGEEEWEGVRPALRV